MKKIFSCISMLLLLQLTSCKDIYFAKVSMCERGDAEPVNVPFKVGDIYQVDNYVNYQLQGGDPRHGGPGTFALKVNSIVGNKAEFHVTSLKDSNDIYTFTDSDDGIVGQMQNITTCQIPSLSSSAIFLEAEYDLSKLAGNIQAPNDAKAYSMFKIFIKERDEGILAEEMRYVGAVHQALDTAAVGVVATEKNATNNVATTPYNITGYNVKVDVSKDDSVEPYKFFNHVFQFQEEQNAPKSVTDFKNVIKEIAETSGGASVYSVMGVKFKHSVLTKIEQ